MCTVISVKLWAEHSLNQSMSSSSNFQNVCQQLFYWKTLKVWFFSFYKTRYSLFEQMLKTWLKVVKYYPNLVSLGDLESLYDKKSCVVCGLGKILKQPYNKWHLIRAYFAKLYLTTLNFIYATIILQTYRFIDTKNEN